MKKLLYTDIKIPFKNQYMVRLDYTGVAEAEINADRRRLVRQCTDKMGASWGYSRVHLERGADTETPPLVLNGTNITAGYFSPTFTPRIYFCFADEIDALQFRLIVGAKSQHVKIWPSIPFTVFEYVDDTEDEFRDGEEYGDL